MNMRAFHYYSQVILMLLNTKFLVQARLPYIKSSGYYSPFPPKSNRIIYEFAPLTPQREKEESLRFEPGTRESKSRETRDLAWREFDAFLTGDEEPSCADLRRMWRLARQLQNDALESNFISKEMQPLKAATYSTMASKEKNRHKESIQASQSNKGEKKANHTM